jgi:hypothetical protein
MIEPYLDLLAEVRSRTVDKTEFKYKELPDQEGIVYDENQQKRFRLLTALQYDRKEDDEQLLAYLFIQEITMHHNSTFQALNDSLALNAFLLARFKNPANVWLFLAAKQANFDTHLGFDYEFLVSAGIEETFNFISTIDDELKEAFFDYMGDTAASCPVAADDLDEWWVIKGGWYKDVLVLDDIEEMIRLAKDLGETAIFREKVNAWKDMQKDWTKMQLSELSYYEKALKNMPGEIWANEQLFELQTDHFRKVSILDTLSSLYLQSGAPEMAWQKVKSAREYLPKIQGWRECGLGRSIVEKAFDIVLYWNDPQNEMGIEAFAWAGKEVKNMQNLHLNLTEKIALSATLMGVSKSPDGLRSIFSKWRKSLDNFFQHKQ